MKLLIYTHEFPPFLGGLASSSYKLVKGLSLSGHDVVALVPAYSLSDKEIDKTLNNKTIRIPLIKNKSTRMIPFLEYLLGWLYLVITAIRVKPDVVLFITEVAEVVGGLFPYYSFKSVVRVAGSGITTCFHSNKINKRLLKYPIRRLYSNAHRIIAVSNFTKELLRQIDVPENKITVIYNGIEKTFLCKEPKRTNLELLKQKYKIDEDDKILLTIARVLPRKGQDSVIKALPNVLSVHSNLKYLVVGEGRFMKKFMDLAEELGVRDFVNFIGGVPHDKTIDFYDLCDIFIMPNRLWNDKVEGLPNAIIEASARGKPVIAGAHGGSIEAVRDGITGYTVNPENIEEISDVIIKLLNDDRKLKELGENGRNIIKKEFNEEAMIKNYLDVLNSLK